MAGAAYRIAVASRSRFQAEVARELVRRRQREITLALREATEGGLRDARLNGDCVDG